MNQQSGVDARGGSFVREAIIKDRKGGIAYTQRCMEQRGCELSKDIPADVFGIDQCRGAER